MYVFMYVYMHVCISIKKPLCNLKCSKLVEKLSNNRKNGENYNIKLPRIFILWLLLVSLYLQKDPQTI